ncbi:FliI/YscN family ATPase [Alicyclobacillus shizuokensis]|uniref:FliI/YscN family ATPase n=1 Tax=Alicyclobacillus shizuokensis TaxID=392014 RepID=UPI00082FF499|nr:FliI/YscN family ATPase [Alicyclobacillus shizuokensis]MCL6627411.1 FliI/YscN family ATPase [Alicyclobacillus shizuokensis]
MVETASYAPILQSMRWFRLYGRVAKVAGMTVESKGPYASIGDICSILSQDGRQCLAEVVGFRDERLLLMPLGELSSIAPGAEVLALGERLTVPCGPGLLGRVLDGLGYPMDGLGPILDARPQPLDTAPPNPLVRQPILNQVQTGVRVIDALLPVGLGQRMGIFAGSGVGKSTLLGMIARNTSADVNVIALIGERGREVREFLERDLGEQGKQRSTVVVATSDQPALIRLKAAFAATAIAEYFRDQGLAVNLMMDSVTRFAMAQREIGLAVGEPPTSRGYTPSVFALLPRLMERAGAGETGSITAFYTVLVDGDDLTDPIADAVRGILDGHIVLSRDLANAGRFPAVDVLASVSRLFSRLAGPGHRQAAVQVRAWLQRYKEVEDLLRIGAYQSGLDKETDVAISRMPELRRFLEQGEEESASVEETVARLCELAGVRE